MGNAACKPKHCDGDNAKARTSFLSMTKRAPTPHRMTPVPVPVVTNSTSLSSSPRESRQHSDDRDGTADQQRQSQRQSLNQADPVADVNVVKIVRAPSGDVQVSMVASIVDEHNPSPVSTVPSEESEPKTPTEAPPRTDLLAVPTISLPASTMLFEDTPTKYGLRLPSPSLEHRLQQDQQQSQRKKLGYVALFHVCFHCLCPPLFSFTDGD